MRRAKKFSQEYRQKKIKHGDHAIPKNEYSTKEKQRLRKTRRRENTTAISQLPYISKVTEKIKKILENKNITVRFDTVQKIEQMLSSHKDQLPKLQTKRVHQLNVFTDNHTLDR